MTHDHYNNRKNQLLLAFAIALMIYYFAGCCSPETIIKDRIDTLYVPVGGEQDTVLINRVDTVWQGETVKYIVRVDTLLRKVFVNRKPDTVRVPYEWRDTVQVYNKIGDSFKDNLYDYAVGFVICVVLLAVVFIIKR